MPLLGFKEQFIDAIREGRKAHTIRAPRKRPIKPGDNLYLYCGLRQSGAFRILANPVVCTKIEQIKIGLEGDVRIDGLYLDHGERTRLAEADGFGGFNEFLGFWQGRLPFHGQIVHWKPPARYEP